MCVRLYANQKPTAKPWALLWLMKISGRLGYFRFFMYFSGSPLNFAGQSLQQKPIVLPSYCVVMFGSTASPSTGQILLTGCALGWLVGSAAIAPTLRNPASSNELKNIRMKNSD